jgi:outer membrane protein assembly factor BamB
MFQVLPSSEINIFAQPYHLIFDHTKMDIKEKTRTAKRTAIVAGAFCTLISLLLLLNYVQMRGSSPLESTVLETLVQRLSLEPNNEELRQEIREFDLLARRAYFSAIWQVRAGGYLLLFASVILVISLRIYHSLQSRILKPEEEDEDEIAGRVLSGKWILAAAGILIIAALLAAFTITDHLGLYHGKIAVSEEASATIRQVTVTDVPATAGKYEPPSLPEAAPGPAVTASSPAASTVAASSPATSSAPAVTASSPAASPAGVPAAYPDESRIRHNHNAFRGPWGQGLVYHENVPAKWDGASGSNILWKVPVPLQGYSSPVIWDERLFITGADEKIRKVFCFDRHSGKLLWEAAADGIAGSPATPPRTTDDTGLGAPTLTTNGSAVFAIFGTGDVLALTMEGERLWARNLGVPDNHYGHSSSLMTHNEKLFVQYDDQKRGRILCLDVLSGNIIWDITRKSYVSWASPILARINNQWQLVAKGNPIVAGYNIENGNELWSVDAMGGEVGPSPAFGGGLVYAANEYSKMIAIDPASGKSVWEDNYYLPEVSSPVYSGGLLFISTTYALIACFDGKTGEMLWEYDTDDIFYSSPIIAGGRVYFTDTGGTTYIFQVAREPVLVGKNILGEEVHSTPAFADGRIYIRGERNLYCIGN